VLQAGSFKNFSDADRRKAQLALLGIEAQIQKVSIDDNTFHRVRIGPIFDPASAKDMQRRLSQSDIEALVIRLRD
jgi:cell division protein FtsN